MKKRRLRVLLVLVVLGVALASSTCAMVSMPGKSLSEPPPIEAHEVSIAAQLRRDVEMLASEIGERNHTRPDKLARAADYVEERFRALGYATARELFDVGGQSFVNVVAEARGSVNELVVVGAHYDSVQGTPGADDNASGVAVMLALAERVAQQKPARTVRFVAFANEEPPFFQRPGMGSLIAAKRWKARGDDVVAMLSLETVGTYSDAPGSQDYPAPLNMLYPSTGNFLGFVGDLQSMKLTRHVVAVFRESARLPSEGAAVPAFIPGVDWSDHWSFWQQGWPAVMVTTTAPYRNPRYHEPGDTPAHVDYERMARSVVGLLAVVDDLARAGERW